MNFVRLISWGLATLVLATGLARAAPLPGLRLAVLSYGTVNWELDVIRHHGLDKAAGVALDVVLLANKDATAIALNAGNVDMIVTDWIWVSRQRDAGADFTFVPYSVAAGSVMVHPESGIATLGDLKDKVLGVAGGPIDKSWLLLRAYSIKVLGRDIADMVEPAFAAPPLLNEKFRQGELDGVLNFWNYTARLRALDMKELIRVQDLLPALGVPGRLPLIGYVFGESWARENRAALDGFLAASREAKRILMTSDAEWERLRKLTRAPDDANLIALRDGYRDGVPTEPAQVQVQAIRAAFHVLAKTGGRALVWHSRELAEGTVWTGQ